MTGAPVVPPLPPGVDPAGFPPAADAVAAMLAANGGPTGTGVYVPPPPPPPISSYQLPTEGGGPAPYPPQPGFPPAAPAYVPPPAPAPAVPAGWGPGPAAPAASAPPAPGFPPAAPAYVPPAPAGYPPVAPPAPGIAPPTPGAPQLVQLPDGTVIGLDRLSELAQLDRAFTANPEVARAVTEATRRHGLLPTAEPPAPPAPPAPGFPPAPAPMPGVVWPPQPTLPYAPPPVAPAPVVLPPAAVQPWALPPGVDPTDPNVQWMLGQATQLQAQQAQIAQQLEVQRQATAQQQAQQAAAGIDLARQELARKYPYLTFDDIATVEARAGQLQLGTAYLRMYGDPHRAAFEAMDSAALTIPELRPKLATVPPATQQALDAQRQAHLNALAGAGGAAPRTAEPQPRRMTTQEKVAGMAQEIQAALAGGPT